jgi:hypothetical protein
MPESLLRADFHIIKVRVREYVEEGERKLASATIKN